MLMLKSQLQETVSKPLYVSSSEDKQEINIFHMGSNLKLKYER